MHSIRIIGPGRAGTSLAAALSARGWAFAGFLGRHDDLSGAARGVDVLKDLEAAAAQWIHTGTTTEPDAGRAPMCRRKTERYISLLASMNRWAEEEKGRQ